MRGRLAALCRADDDHDDSGSATIWLVGFAALLVVAFFAALALGQVVVASHRAGSAADLAALAAVAHAADGPGSACAVAAAVAAAQRARLVGCLLSSDSVTVRVRVSIPKPLLPVGPAFGAARAGPTSPGLGPDGGARS